MNSPPIRSERIELLPFTEQMVSNSFIGWLNDPQVNLFLEVRHYKVTIKKQKALVKRYIKSTNTFYWALALKNGDIIGSVKFTTDKYGVGEIGIFIGDVKYWNMGIATESIHTLSNWVEAQKAARKLSAGAYSSNEGSIKAFLKNGFEIEGLRKGHILDEASGATDLVLLGKILSEAKSKISDQDFT